MITGFFVKCPIAFRTLDAVPVLSRSCHEEYRTAIALRPDYADPRNSLGEIFLKRGRARDALHEFLTATRLNPDFELARTNLNNLAKTTRD